MSRSKVSRRVREFVGVALFAAALIWIISLVSYEPADPVWFFSTGAHADPANFAGRVGAFLAELSFQLFGYASYAIPAVLVAIGWHSFWCRDVDAAGTKATGAALLFACISAFLSLVFGTLDLAGKPFRAGGYAGEWLAKALSEYLNRTGSVVVVLTLIFLAIIMSTQFSFGRFFAAVLAGIGGGAGRALTSFREWREDRRRERQRRDVIAKHTKKGAPPPEISPAPVATLSPKKRRRARRGRSALRACVRRSVARSRSPRPSRQKSRLPPSMLPLPDPEPVKAPAERRKGDYALPPAALLDAPKVERKIDERELMDGARLLEEKCREFSVEGSVVQIHPGPVVTTFEFKPDAGVKYSKITGLADDLCLAMQAESVLIDRIPGKSTVGIQIPNHNREPISLRELLESEAYRRSTSKLTLALGKTIHGEPFVADLGHDAPSADRRIHGRRQVGGHQRHVDQHPLSGDARRRAADHDRSQASRARHVRGHPSPADPGCRRSQAGGKRAAMGRARNGRAVQDARRRGRAQHRAVQPKHSAGDHRETDAAERRSAEAPPLHRRRHR